MCLTSALPKILTEVETFGERCIDEANIKEVVDIIEVKRVPRIIKGRPGRLYRKGRW